MGRKKDALAKAEQVLSLRDVKLGTPHEKNQQALTLDSLLAAAM